MSETVQRRAVAIIGRPNVGKSAIFNRLLGRRAAIVHEHSGVTRDRLAAEVLWGERSFELIDTGGIAEFGSAPAGDRIQAGMQRQIEQALADAAVVVLATDVQAGLAPLDTYAAGRARRGGRPVFVAANKADNPRLDEQADEFLAFGFPVFPVSALHNRGFDALLEAVAAALPATDSPADGEPLRVTVAGHPNVGKSSYINRVLNSERLIVSEQPGTTRDSVDIPFRIGRGAQARHYLLTDTPGLVRARRVKSSLEHFSLARAERSIRAADVVVFVLDAQQGPNAHDKKIAACILRWNKGCVLLVNKWDLAGKTTQRAYRAALARTFPWLDFVPVVFVSAHTGYNVRQSIETVERVAGRLRTQIPTAPLNRALAEACAARLPPEVKGRRLKIYYATQAGVGPIRILLFVNDPRRLTPVYQRYLTRRFHEAFELEGAPIVLQARAKREK
ncbi:MAG: ribosome biogenesis GTPase Der [Kiritimatiellae bacterium]|nr:ribosome biogenesis GTPase Der [Kiritimatiellia bacterium]